MKYQPKTIKRLRRFCGLKKKRCTYNAWGSMDMQYLKRGFFYQIINFTENCKYKQCFICHAPSYSRLWAKCETKNMSSRERVKNPEPDIRMTDICWISGRWTGFCYSRSPGSLQLGFCMSSVWSTVPCTHVDCKRRTEGWGDCKRIAEKQIFWNERLFKEN